MRTKSLPGALAAAALIVCFGSSVAHAAVGQAYYSQAINWINSPALYFSVAAGPAHTCGDLWTMRNGGAWVEGPGWLCTDGSGNATKGPWTWANQPSDETAYAYIEWPDGTRTNTAKHIWDKTAPTASITSPGGSPPSSFYGTAKDAAWGAGFSSSWSSCGATFRNDTTGMYWTQSGGSYSQYVRNTHMCSFTATGMNLQWNAVYFPAAWVHDSSNCYTWEVRIFDGGQYGVKSISFCV